MNEIDKHTHTHKNANFKGLVFLFRKESGFRMRLKLKKKINGSQNRPGFDSIVVYVQSVMDKIGK
jgi:hypothetical protein